MAQEGPRSADIVIGLGNGRVGDEPFVGDNPGFMAPLGNLTGRLPIGNTGRANVSAFAPMNENASGPMASP